MNLSRRAFITASVLAGGGLAIGATWQPGTGRKGAHGSTRAAAVPAEINAWLEIDTDGIVTIRSPYSEYGQGSMTSVAMFVADELDVPWENVRIKFADPNRQVNRGQEYGSMRTSASLVVREYQNAYRQAGASARQRLRYAAAQAWGVDPSDVTARDGQLTARGKTAGYGAFATAAAAVQLSSEPDLKQPDQWRLVGQAVSRLDVPQKVDGSAKYPMDISLPGMLCAAVSACPVPRGRIQSFDADPVRGMPGVVDVIALDEDVDRQLGRFESAVAVVADTWWNASAALAKLKVSWKAGGFRKVGSDDIDAAAQQKLGEDLPQTENAAGDAAAVMATATRKVSAAYQRPYDFSAPMSPPAAVADVREDGVDLWLFAKDSEVELRRAALFLGRDPSTVRVHPVFQGGSFGSGIMLDLSFQALALSRQLQRPVKVIWSREESMRRAVMRPAVWARFEAALGEDGYPTAVHIRALAQRANGGFLSRGWTDTGYRIPNLRVDGGGLPTPLPVGANRAPGYNSNSFMMEQFVDEMALAAGIDPLAWRLKMSEGNERWQRVLRRLASEFADAAPLPKGQGRGFAAAEIHDTAVACCAEVDISRKGELKVQRVTLVADPGYVLNAKAAEEQLQGGVAWELGFVLYGGLEIERGAVRQVNFDSYPPLRFGEMPEVVTHLELSRDGWWGGMGEASVPVLGPAVANAIFSAVGVRCRRTPFSAFDLSWSS